MLNMKFDHKMYGMGTKISPTDVNALVNDELPAKLLSGQIHIRPAVNKFIDSKTVQFIDESQLTDIDDVISCTGYKVAFPLLSNAIFNTDDQENTTTTTFRHFIDLSAKHKTMFVIGYMRANGSIPSLGEMQARFSCEVLLGNVNLPEIDKTKITKTLNVEEPKITKRPFVTYMDELANFFGAKPNLWQIFFQDQVLWRSLVFGPVAPYQYRLGGPQKWSGARKAQLEVWKRTIYPLQVGKSCENATSKNRHWFLLILIGFSACLLYWLW